MDDARTPLGWLMKAGKGLMGGKGLMLGGAVVGAGFLAACLCRRR